jgi:hypothetical protein
MTIAPFVIGVSMRWFFCAALMQACRRLSNGQKMWRFSVWGTAAGAELVAAALQDHQRAKVLGMATAGRCPKGTTPPGSARPWPS